MLHQEVVSISTRENSNLVITPIQGDSNSGAKELSPPAPAPAHQHPEYQSQPVVLPPYIMPPEAHALPPSTPPPVSHPMSYSLQDSGTPQLVCGQVPPPPMTSDPSPVPSSPGCIIALVPPYMNPSLPESPLSHNGGPPVSEFPSDRHNPNSLPQFTEEQEILSPPFIQRDGTNPGM